MPSASKIAQIGINVGLPFIPGSGISKKNAAIGAALTAVSAIPVVGPILSAIGGFFTGIFGQAHAKKVAVEQQTNANFVDSFNSMVAQFDAVVANGELCGADAVQQTDAIYFGKLLPMLDPIRKGPAAPTRDVTKADIIARGIGLGPPYDKPAPGCNAGCVQGWSYAYLLRDRQEKWAASKLAAISAKGIALPGSKCGKPISWVAVAAASSVGALILAFMAFRKRG